MTQKRDMLLELTTRASGLLVPERYFNFASSLGQKTLNFAFTYTQAGLVEPSKHLRERVQAEMPINEAKIGAQYVGIATKTRAERLAKLREAVKKVGLPHDEIAELDVTLEQIDLGKKMAAKNGDLPIEIVEGMEKEVVSRMEDVVKSADIPTDELDAMKKNIRTYSIVGHGAIAQAVLDAETAAFVPDDITLKTVNIARRVQTHPELLVPPGWLSEFEAARAEEIMQDVPTRVM